MQTDPVRSIRMAAALNQRYGALLRTNTGDSVDALELKIGEMNQIYPEIWRYLDEARTALGERGITVVDYDAVRATERPGSSAPSRSRSRSGSTHSASSPASPARRSSRPKR